MKCTHAAPTKFALPAGTCQALEIFEKKEKEKERLAKEKAERDEKEGPSSTGEDYFWH